MGWNYISLLCLSIHLPGLTSSFMFLNEYILHLKHMNELFLKVSCMYIMFINIRFKLNKERPT